MNYEESEITAISKERFDAMVTYVINNAGDEFLLDIMQTPEEQVVGKHHMFVGRHIRNHFQLWEVEHAPVIENGIDVSTNHPDHISSCVILAARTTMLNKAETLDL